MTPGQIIALIRDAAIVGGILAILWIVYRGGENTIKRDDLQAVQKQLRENAQHAAQYAQQSQSADQQRADDLAQVRLAIAGQRAPVVVMRGPANPGPVSCPPTSPGAQPTGAGPAISGAREDTVDVRPAINGYENRIEQVVADCRAALAKWPR